jgi:uncharacterized protein involved in oxidation of intracellular sulfur
MAKTLFILNDPPYGTERSYNALRLAGSLSKREGEEVKVFLIGDAASCAKRDQKAPQGYYNAEVMLRNVQWADRTLVFWRKEIRAPWLRPKQS